MSMVTKTTVILTSVILIIAKLYMNLSYVLCYINTASP